MRHLTWFHYTPPPCHWSVCVCVGGGGAGLNMISKNVWTTTKKPRLKCYYTVMLRRKWLHPFKHQSNGWNALPPYTLSLISTSLLLDTIKEQHGTMCMYQLWSGKKQMYRDTTHPYLQLFPNAKHQWNCEYCNAKIGSSVKFIYLVFVYLTFLVKWYLHIMNRKYCEDLLKQMKTNSIWNSNHITTQKKIRRKNYKIRAVIWHFH